MGGSKDRHRIGSKKRHRIDRPHLSCRKARLEIGSIDFQRFVAWSLNTKLFRQV